MGKVTRKRHSAEFKAKVALESIKGEQTLAELGAKHGIHQTMIATWKRQAIDGLQEESSWQFRKTCRMIAQLRGTLNAGKVIGNRKADAYRQGIYTPFTLSEVLEDFQPVRMSDCAGDIGELRKESLLGTSLHFDLSNIISFDLEASKVI